jgi:hypothetical protein
MPIVTFPSRGERGSHRRAVGARPVICACACAWLCSGWVAWRPAGARAAGAYVGEYAGQYSFRFAQNGQQPGHGYSDEAQEDFSWDVRFASGSGSQPPVASMSAGGTDRFARAGDVEDPESVTCTISANQSPQLAPRYFAVEAGAVAGTVDVRAIVPVLTGATGQVTVAPANGVCAGVDATGAAVNCDPFGCAWECVSFAAAPAFDGAWAISLTDAQLGSFPRSFQASESMSPCSEPTVSYAAERSLSATLDVVAADPAGKAARKPARRRRRTRAHGRSLHSAGDDRGSR